MKKQLDYFGSFLLMSYLCIPFLVSLLIAMVSFSDYRAITPFVILILFGLADYSFAKSVLTGWELPQTFLARYLPVAIPLVLTLLSWAGCMVATGGAYFGAGFAPFFWFHLAYIPSSIAFNCVGPPAYLFYTPLIHNLLLLGCFAFLERRRPDKSPLPKRQLLGCGALCLACAITGGTVAYQRSQTILPPKSYGFAYGDGYASVDIYRYDPLNPDNLLPTLEGPSFFHLEEAEDYPVLDGAEAAYPVYSAFANACYRGFSSEEKRERRAAGEAIPFSNTIYAYESLLEGEVDIFFGAQPSAAQRQMAEEQGLTLTLTPIGKEAFVFFVSRENPAENLTIQQIRDIYSGELENWEAITGQKTKILPFQRPENSGSQTILEKIMGDTPIRPPLREEYISGMGGVSQGVADYRNSMEALGYSFRFFTTGMAENAAEIRLLSIEGIPPTTENIQNDSYPFTVNLYAITIQERETPILKNFLAWMQGEQGQYLVKGVGYVPLS